ncbi:glutamate--cysteine ligase [Bowmanella dokdonensis]|uniref:Glutamate--cysteine ligase n=1 Tax=Bowmanella dokdonensis TaxID=751969 RepID=A0A939DR34_9ALTE|nr:glutamate--cysteine ligase [Bowmanella dokdonensis]MBN7827449.1 glutamate--cysteine ligase [Bowmanella dokdonensis]
MQQHDSTFAARLAILAKPQVADTLKGILRGIEREALRINADGSIAQTPHPRTLGSALCHDLITTDFSEALLEFITQPHADPRQALAQLRDIHKFVLEHLGDERLWPVSMPCYIDSEDSIPLARYGTSNVGRMKTLYRTGLKNRYGSMMQAIAGVHFNFSLPRAFWQSWLPEVSSRQADQDGISEAYFALIRNYRRFCWLIPYLYGASPALCSSFLQGKETSLPFETLPGGSCYLPYATSLRMSDLGYTNKAQSGLNICYNQLDKYLGSLREAIRTPSREFARFAGKKDGEYQQLNANVLQIENELYSPIRPKQPTRRLEKPSDALAERGVSYIEVRALDVNPFSEVGICLNQFYFLDAFLVYCAIHPSASMTQEDFAETDRNLRAVVTEGRRPGLMLSKSGQSLSLQAWAQQLFADIGQVARVMDEAMGCDHYSASVTTELEKVLEPALTPSARILDHLQSSGQNTGQYALEMAQQYKQRLLLHEYSFHSKEELLRMVEQSWQRQAEEEASDSLSFDAFLQDYFALQARTCA